jgi:hypothetical protein
LKQTNVKQSEDVRNNIKARGENPDETAYKEMYTEMSSGMFLCGTVVGRNRSYVGESKRELITYKIMANNSVYFMKDWRSDPSSDYFCVGEIIRVPVVVRVNEYKGKHNLNITLNNEETGEF